MIVIVPTQRQTPSLVGATLFYQSQGSYFDLAGNIERVMMFSVENPLWSDCGPCLLVLFRCINLTAERSGILLPLFSIQIISQAISQKFANTEKLQKFKKFFFFLFPNDQNLLDCDQEVTRAGKHKIPAIVL